MFRLTAALTMTVGLAAAAPAAQQPVRGSDAAATIARVGARVVEWYARAQSIVSKEDVWITPLGFDMSPAAPPRRLGYELRVAWEPERTAPDAFPEPSIVRQILSINGRPPRAGEEPECMDPKPVTPEPLMMFLPAERGDFQFTHVGTARLDGRPAMTIDYKAIARDEPKVTWTKQCVSVSLPGRAFGRIWVDPGNYDVLRLDEHLAGLFEFDVPREQQRVDGPRSMVIERADSSIRYRRVQFRDPDDTVMVPAQIDTTTVVRGGSIRRTHISQRFSGHRRFVSDVRIID